MLKNPRNKGITLIALVVTIIVLLILAGISISMLSGNNGILTRAAESKENTKTASEKEQISIAILGSYDETTLLNLEKLKSNLENNGATVLGDSFPITVIMSDKKYTIESNGNVQEVDEKIVTIAELREKASTYFGYDVINYAETLPNELQDTKWQLFYAGPLEGENNGRIYLISKEYVKNTQLPSVVKNGVKVTPEAKPIDGSTEYKAGFGNSESDGIMSQYTGSSDISENMKKYNKDYLKKYSSNNPNMKAVAYMLDTGTWSPFATSSKKFAEYAMGGPSIELLFTAYNKYTNKTLGQGHLSEAVHPYGYGVAKDGSNVFLSRELGMIENDAVEENKIDSPYSVSSLINVASFYWLSSPSYDTGDSTIKLLTVGANGMIFSVGYNEIRVGFRPVVLLNSNFQLEKTKDSNNNDAFKIVKK